MNIEVTKEAFELIFEPLMFQETENLEHANKFYYDNSNANQNGILIHNFIGDKMQYYLIDINA